MNFKLLYPLVLAIFCTGCASTLHLSQSRENKPIQDTRNAVYVTNPELEYEFEILRMSGICDLSDRRDTSTKLTLHPLRQYPGCQNPLMLTIFTFGIIPGQLPGRYEFSYDLVKNGQNETVKYRLPIYERISVWEHLFSQDRTAIFAKALRLSHPIQVTNATHAN